MKEAPGCRAGPRAPAALSSACPHREITRQMAWNIHAAEVMKSCICALAFLLRSADLQYKVRPPPRVRALIEMNGAATFTAESCMLTFTSGDLAADPALLSLLVVTNFIAIFLKCL